MELIQQEMPQDFTILYLGDTHDGNAASSMSAFEEALERLKEKNIYAILTGDAIEAIAIDDGKGRWSTEVHDASFNPGKQASVMGERLKPFRKRIICQMTGNHERKHWRTVDLTQVICDTAGIKYGGFSNKVTFVDRKGREYFKSYAIHGKHGIGSNNPNPVKRKAAKLARLQSLLMFKASDAAVMVTAHCHQLLSLAPERELLMTDDGVSLRGRYSHPIQTGDDIPYYARWYGASGSFLRSTIVGKLCYSEEAAYDPIMQGYLQLDVQGGIIQGLREIHLGDK